MKTLRIMIANNREIVRAGLRALLQHYEGWEICGEAADGLEAVDKAAQLNPDVIILDVGMPNLDRYLMPKGAALSLAETTVETTENSLTRREREVVQLVSEGKSTKEVASVLGISVKTAETHRSNIMRKLDFHSVTELVLYAVRHQIVQVWPAAAAST